MDKQPNIAKFFGVFLKLYSIFYTKHIFSHNSYGLEVAKREQTHQNCCIMHTLQTC